MKIAEILAPQYVIAELTAETKPQILLELAKRLAEGQKQVSLNDLKAVLSERERLGSTAIGDGIAIPHGKVPGIQQIVGTFGRSTKGVDFDSLDGKPTHLFFLLVAPEDSASLHLKALARVSRLFRDNAFRENLMKAKDAAEIYQLILEEDSRY
ncbi:MAG TPA: PTS sugar transporter subunit IIA [Candidatus Binataceae bacterium]|jgi:PTS system nitrogen regulatory IIA component|nr:PTS sugar transporter subunit IIA [Candidatus Binataceae bacterium]